MVKSRLGKNKIHAVVKNRAKSYKTCREIMNVSATVLLQFGAFSRLKADLFFVGMLVTHLASF